MNVDLQHLEGYEYLLTALVFAVVLSSYMIGLHLWNRRRMRAMGCVWEYDKIQPHGGLHRWVCAACGEAGFTKRKRAPVECKRWLGGSGL